MTRTPALVSGAVPDATAGFGWDSLQGLLDFGNFGSQQAGVRGVSAPALVGLRAQATGDVVRADVAAVQAGLAAGGTFSVNSLDDLHPWVRARAEELENEVLLPVNVNCHVSLKGESALGVHADQHDVHALQTAGSKRWQVFGNGDEPGPQTHEFVTVPGDELFLPRGWWHLVHTVAPSIHLTIGVSWPTASQLVGSESIDDELWSLPLVPDTPPDIRERIQDSLAAALGRPPAGLIDALLEDLRVHTRWRSRSDLLASVEPVAAFRLRKPKWCRRRDSDGSVVVEGSAMSVSLPRPAGPLVDALLIGETLDLVRASDLTGGVVDGPRFDQVASALGEAGLIERVNVAARE